jgi:zinc/manganese transport system substrate-binding protein
MKTLTLIALLVSGLLSGTSAASSSAPSAPRADKLNVVATVPDLAWFAEQIGGDRVEVKSLAKGTENMHSLTVRPRTIVAMSKADVLLEMGLSLESTWLPELVLTSRNRKIRAGDPGRVTCSTGWEAMHVPSSLSRQGGDLHPDGNPHFALSPLAGTTIAENVYKGLVLNDPAGEQEFKKRYDSLTERLAKAAKRWARYQQLFADAEGSKKVVVYHMEFDYMLSYLGLETEIAIEPKPGVPPTPSHLAKVIQAMRDQGIRVVMTASWSRSKQVTMVASKVNAEVLELPTMVKGAEWAGDWIALIDGSLERMRIGFGLPELKQEPAREPEGK